MLHLLNFIHWNASPEIFNLGPLSVRWYGLLFASGFLIGYYIGERMFKSEKTPQKWIDSLFFYIIIATIVGARLGHVFFYGWEYYSQHPSCLLYTSFLPDFDFLLAIDRRNAHANVNLLAVE